jgi:hypothetical protein
MTDPGPNATEAARIVQRGRAKVIAVAMQAIEENGEAMHPAEADRIKRIIKDEVNGYADGICALLPNLVDESVTMNALAMEVLADIRSSLTELADQVRGQDG